MRTLKPIVTASKMRILVCATYRPGQVWPTASGRFGGMNGAGNIQYFDDREDAKSYTKGGAQKRGGTQDEGRALEEHEIAKHWDKVSKAQSGTERHIKTLHKNPGQAVEAIKEYYSDPKAYAEKIIKENNLDDVHPVFMRRVLEQRMGVLHRDSLKKTRKEAKKAGKGSEADSLYQAFKALNEKTKLADDAPLTDDLETLKENLTKGFSVKQRSQKDIDSDIQDLERIEKEEEEKKAASKPASNAPSSQPPSDGGKPAPAAPKPAAIPAPTKNQPPVAPAPIKPPAPKTQQPVEEPEEQEDNEQEEPTNAEEPPKEPVKTDRPNQKLIDSTKKRIADPKRQVKVEFDDKSFEELSKTAGFDMEDLKREFKGAKDKQLTEKAWDKLELPNLSKIKTWDDFNAHLKETGDKFSYTDLYSKPFKMPVIVSYKDVQGKTINRVMSGGNELIASKLMGITPRVTHVDLKDYSREEQPKQDEDMKTKKEEVKPTPKAEEKTAPVVKKEEPKKAAEKPVEAPKTEKKVEKKAPAKTDKKAKPAAKKVKTLKKVVKKVVKKATKPTQAPAKPTPKVTKPRVLKPAKVVKQKPYKKLSKPTKKGK